MNILIKNSIALFILLLVSPENWALTLSETTLSMSIGDTRTVTITDSTGKTRLSNSDSQVVSAQKRKSKVTIEALSPGNATLTVSDRRESVSLTVAVVPDLTISPQNLVLNAGESADISVNNPSGSVEIDISNDNVISATLSNNQVTVNALLEGSSILTIRDSKTAITVPVTVLDDGGTGNNNPGDFSLVAWNDLGMHCMDADYSVFSILPPYNNLHAQLVNRTTGELVTTGVELTYQSEMDPAGSINTTSEGKTNFWDYVMALFGVDLEPDVGLAGKPTASPEPANLEYLASNQEFVAEGIPITPFDDDGNKNFYPLVNVTASDTAGKILATARVVLPVSDEMSCTNCHTSRNTGSAEQMAAKPIDGWVFDIDPERDYRRNVLKLHDELSANSAVFTNALSAKGYDPSGLLATADNGSPILCAACHSSNALPGTGLAGIAPLTEVMHAAHAVVADPSNGLALDDSNNRSACYQCHPGSDTRCLRGAMGSATADDGSLAMQCQSCHGKMSNVGATGRVGWLDQPNCQSCHHDGLREVSALDELGAVKAFMATMDTRFASNPDTPAPGFSLFRMSKGHGDLQCEACHGATHAIYPSSHENDNLLSLDLQGHEGTIRECSVCHKQVPLTSNGGPHGVHTFGQVWVKEHHDYTEGKESTCAYCHGADYRGSPLSTMKKEATFSIGDGRTHSYSPGDQVGCYDCHNGPFH